MCGIFILLHKALHKAFVLLSECKIMFKVHKHIKTNSRGKKLAHVQIFLRTQKNSDFLMLYIVNMSFLDNSLAFMFMHPYFFVKNSVTFCGITMKNYVGANISTKSNTTVKYAMKMLSSSSETIIFMFLGVSTIHDDHEWNSGFIAATIIFCTIYRIMGE